MKLLSSSIQKSLRGMNSFGYHYRMSSSFGGVQIKSQIETNSQSYQVIKRLSRKRRACKCQLNIFLQKGKLWSDEEASQPANRKGKLRSIRFMPHP
jgi:hypothetical protein